MFSSFSCQLCNCFIYRWIYLAVCTMRPTMGWALPSKIWIARAYSKEDWLKRKKQINLTWGIENIREIPIIDVICHNPEIQGSDVPVLLSSFVFMYHQPIIELPFHKQKRSKLKSGMRNILIIMFLRLLDQLSGREAGASPSANLKSRRFNLRATQHLHCHCNGQKGCLNRRSLGLICKTEN